MLVSYSAQWWYIKLHRIDLGIGSLSLDFQNKTTKIYLFINIYVVWTIPSSVQVTLNTKKKQKYIIIFVFGFVLWVNNFVVWIDFVRVLNRMLYVILIYCCLFRFSECYEYILVNFERILPILLSAKWNHIWVRITEITIDEE